MCELVPFLPLEPLPDADYHCHHHQDRRGQGQLQLEPLASAGGEELRLQRIELVAVALRPLPRHRQTGAAVEEAAVPAVGLPLPCGLDELAVDPQADPVRVDPLAESAPATDQGFVGDLHRAVGRAGSLGRDQPRVAVGQDPDHPFDRLGPRGVVGQKLVIGDVPLGVLGPLARLHQVKENATAEVLVRLGELLQGIVGPVLQGTFDTPQLGVGPEREPADLAALPQVVESELEQRQGPGLAFDVGQEPFG